MLIPACLNEFAVTMARSNSMFAAVEPAGMPTWILDRIGKACTDSNHRELTIRRKVAPDADRVGHHTEMGWDTQPGQTSIYTMCI